MHIRPKFKNSTILLIGLLLAEVKILSAKETSDNHLTRSSSLNKFSETSDNRLFNHGINQQEDPITPIINEASLGQFFSGTSSQYNAFVNSFMEIRALHPALADYLDLPFIHLPDFNINMKEGNQITASTDGQYYDRTHTVFFPESLNFNSRQAKDLILHEFRHAAWQAVQQTLGGNKIWAVDNYFPLTPEEKKLVQKMFENGYQNVLKLKKKLGDESTGKLSKAEQKELNQIRKKATLEYQAHYKRVIPDIIPLNNLIQRGLLIQFQYDFQSGKMSISNTFEDIAQQYKKLLPHLSLQKIQMSDDMSQVTLYSTCDDPLTFAINEISFNEKILQTTYSPRDGFYERDAFLFGTIPVSLIEYLYPEWFNYSNNIMMQAKATPILFKKPLREYKDYTTIYNKGRLNFLTTTDAITLDEDSNQFESAIKYALRNNQLEYAKTLLKSQINRGENVSSANIMLARIAYHEDNHKLAATYYKRAKKQGAYFTGADCQWHINALNSTGFFKEAKKRSAKMQSTFSNVTQNTQRSVHTTAQK